jgi:lipoic acid synthetase
MGFLYVASGPLVRCSYRAGDFFMKVVIEKKRKAELAALATTTATAERV